MRMQVFTAGLAMVGLLSGCIIRSEQPVAKEKGIGQLLDDIFSKGAKGAANFAEEAKKVDALVKKSTQTALKEDEVKQLARSVVRGGSEAIAAFKQAPIMKLGTAEELLTSLTNRIEAQLGLLTPKQLNQLEQLDSMDAVAFIKQHTNLADDKIVKKQVELLGKQIDEAAEAVADNHMLANAIGEEFHAALSGELLVSLMSKSISPDRIVSELKLSLGDFSRNFGIRFDGSSGRDTPIKIIQEITGVDIWRETAHLELMLRRGDDGKAIYKKLSASEVKRLGNPFDKNFTPPLISFKENMFAKDGYLLRVYRKPTKGGGDDKLLEELLERL